MRIRTRSGSSETEGFRRNFLPDYGSRSPGGGLIRGLQKLWKNPTGQAAVTSPSTPDGRQSPIREEPQASEEQQTLPATVIPTFEQCLEGRHLYEADQLLIDREKHLFGEITETDALKHHDEDVAKLAADRAALEKLVLQSVLQSFSLSPEDPALTSALTSAIKAIQLEEEQDRLWEQGCRTEPAWRPCKWKNLHESELRTLVEERMDNPSASPSSLAEQSSINKDIQSMGRQLKEDLLQVVKVVKSCYPPEMGICNFYATLYHQIFSVRLRKIADFGLDDKDCTYLLRWVNEFYPGILQKPELEAEINSAEFGKLLPPELLEPLEEQYLSKQQIELMMYISRVLEEAQEKWRKQEVPAMEDGCYVSPVAYDIIQVINGMVTSAETVVGDLHKAQRITCDVTGLMQRFKVFQEDVIKSNRPNGKAQIKAHLGSIEQFRDVLVRKKHLFPEDVQENCLSVLTDMRQSAHAFLLTPVHKVLKPHYQKLGTSDWLNKNQFEKLLAAMEKELLELRGSTESCHQKLIGQLHQEVTEEYVRRLLRGDVKLKDKEKQHKAYTIVKDNAECLHELLNEMGSREEWLKEILIKIAEVLKLQDIPAIQMHIVALGFAHSDLSEKHVSALLKLKTNLSQADRRTVKETLSDSRKEADIGADFGTRPFFSKVEVRRSYCRYSLPRS